MHEVERPQNQVMTDTFIKVLLLLLYGLIPNKSHRPHHSFVILPLQNHQKKAREV